MVELLFGVNKLCEGCTEECKQWKQVKVVKCPLYKPLKSVEKGTKVVTC